MSNKDIKLGKGIFGQMQDAPVYKPKKLTKKDLKEFMEAAQKEHEAFVKHYAKLQDKWAKHWADKKKEHGEEPPMWLMLITSPDVNRINHGTFMTSREFMDKHKKWLI